MPVIPAFFIGLTSLVATARLTRSTEATAEAIGTAPGSEGRRTAALALACLVPFAAGAAWIALLLALVSVDGAHPYEWWFGTMPDWQVWAILAALGPVACIGGGLLGVLTGRWLRFPGAAAVMVVVVVAIDMVGQMPVTYDATSELRLWVPWAMFHSGSETDGTSILFAGNAGFYLVYVLCLCAAAALFAIWHDRTARTGSAPHGDRRRGHRGSRSARTGDDHRQRRQPPLEADPLQDQQVMLVGWYLRRAIPWMALLGCCAGGPAAGGRAGPVADERVDPAPRPGRHLRRGRRVLLRRGVPPGRRGHPSRRDLASYGAPRGSRRAPRRLDPLRPRATRATCPWTARRGGWSGSPPSRSPSDSPRSPRGTRSPAPADRWPPRWCWS